MRRYSYLLFKKEYLVKSLLTAAVQYNVIRIQCGLHEEKKSSAELGSTLTAQQLN